MSTGFSWPRNKIAALPVKHSIQFIAPAFCSLRLLGDQVAVYHVALRGRTRSCRWPVAVRNPGFSQVVPRLAGGQQPNIARIAAATPLPAHLRPDAIVFPSPIDIIPFR